MGKDLKNLEQLFYNSEQIYCHDSFESEFGFAFPVDAEKAFVFDDSQTVFKLKNGDYMINATDGSEHTYKTLCEAKKELWNEILNYEML